MTDQEISEFEQYLDEFIKDKNVEYHFDNFLKNVLGVHDLDDVCYGHAIDALFAIQRHVEERIDALPEPENPMALGN